MAYEDFPQAAISSGSIPGAFPPQHFMGYYLYDGGTVWNANVDSAVRQCMEIVDDYSKISLDILVC